jgi:hypothetical protein
VIDMYVGSKLGASGVLNQLCYRFWDKYKDHRVAFTVIETNFAPTLMGDEAFRERAEVAGTILVPYHTKARGRSKGSKWDEEYGIGAMQPLFSGGLIAFANATTMDRVWLQPLIDDMLTFPWSEQQDALVALWVANSESNLYNYHKTTQQEYAVTRRVPPYLALRQNPRKS